MLIVDAVGTPITTKNQGTSRRTRTWAVQCGLTEVGTLPLFYSLLIWDLPCVR